MHSTWNISSGIHVYFTIHFLLINIISNSSCISLIYNGVRYLSWSRSLAPVDHGHTQGSCLDDLDGCQPHGSWWSPTCPWPGPVSVGSSCLLSTLSTSTYGSRCFLPTELDWRSPLTCLGEAAWMTLMDVSHMVHDGHPLVPDQVLSLWAVPVFCRHWAPVHMVPDASCPQS